MTVRLTSTQIDQLRRLIPKDIKVTTDTHSSELREWLTRQNIQTSVTTRCIKYTMTIDIEFFNLHDETLFRIKYSDYISPL